MYFMDDERLREYERFMQHTPHYRPRGCGVIGIRIMDTKPPPAPYEERMGQMAASYSIPILSDAAEPIPKGKRGETL